MYVIPPPAAGPPWLFPAPSPLLGTLPQPGCGCPRHLSPHTGYSGPLKEVPPEKFNVTAIPKGYRSPWQELLGDKDNALHSKNQPPMRPSPWDFRSFNR